MSELLRRVNEWQPPPFSFFPSNVGRKIGQTDHEPEKKNCSKTLGGKIDCGSGVCIRVCQVFQKLCLRKILCSIKVTSVGQQKSGFEPMASQKDYIGDPSSEFRQDLC